MKREREREVKCRVVEISQKTWMTEIEERKMGQKGDKVRPKVE